MNTLSSGIKRLIEPIKYMIRIKVYSMRMVLIYNDIYCHIEGGFYYGSFETPRVFAEFTDFYLFFSIWESWATLKAFPLITAF